MRQDLAFEPLDLFSTSPTGTPEGLVLPPVFCPYKAPYFAFRKGESTTYGVVQGNCNHWDCPVHGRMRAKEEYGRIVHGANLLSRSGKLYFITVTCRGVELPKEEAIRGYLEWTNRLLDALRIDWNRRRKSGVDGVEMPDWAYVQVTERQKRGHPHSHILTTYYPRGLYVREVKKRWQKDNTGKRIYRDDTRLGSDYLQERVISAGLGEQYDISEVVSSEAASRYVAKYMFKSEMFQADFPKGWRRVRYSQSYPKLPDVKTDAFVLISKEDWQKLASVASKILVKDENTALECGFNLGGHDIPIMKAED